MTTVAAEAPPRYDTLLVGGELVAADPVHPLVSPSTERPVATVPLATTEQADAAVAAARAAFDDGPWPAMSIQERAGYLTRIADMVEAEADDIARAATGEMGAPLSMSRGMHAGGLGIWRDAAALGAAMGATAELEEVRRWDGGWAEIIREPVGVVLGIPSWNGPPHNMALKAAQPLLAGCPVILKLTPQMGLTAERFSRIFAGAGLPPGVVSVLPADVPVTEQLVRHPGVDKVSFTGSTAVGRTIMALCAERIARVTLELGGKSAAIVMPDLDPRPELARTIVGGIVNSGQVCTANTRILLPRHRHDEWLDALVAALETVRVGDPFDDATEMGPLVTDRQRDRVEGYIALGKDAGARLVYGGGRPADLPVGWYVEPTLFDRVDSGMRIAQEEIFGPVLSVLDYDGEDDAVALANDTPYGLAASVFTDDDDTARRVARRLRIGVVRVNSIANRPSLPFGGFKQSGIGREGGREGLEAYLEVKQVKF